MKQTVAEGHVIGVVTRRDSYIATKRFVELDLATRLKPDPVPNRKLSRIAAITTAVFPFLRWNYSS